MLGGAETVSSGKTRAETTTSREQQTADRLYLMELPKPLSSEALPMLREGINMALSRWSALQMAVENEWGSRNSRDIANKLCDDVFVWFTHSKDEKLDQGLLSLNTEADDGSIGEVAEKLMILHEECSEGNYSSIEKLREACAHRMVHSHVKQLRKLRLLYPVAGSRAILAGMVVDSTVEQLIDKEINSKFGQKEVTF
ncbi:hypothetical protein CDL15_Pgr017551 [Punica granatum]|uniref:Pre-rRNA-processing protein TSR2 homolog n=1 Tax=Punica granatum TaxID=22663 RepID=A0A218W615_PUNGR|nr:hypothetical protein CDL15_Pgr017551 [Punica granatum]